VQWQWLTKSTFSIAKARERSGKARLPWYNDWTYSEKTGKLLKGRKKKDDD
jgi:hypothetical protein